MRKACPHPEAISTVSRQQIYAKTIKTTFLQKARNPRPDKDERLKAKNKKGKSRRKEILIKTRSEAKAKEQKDLFSFDIITALESTEHNEELRKHKETRIEKHRVVA